MRPDPSAICDNQLRDGDILVDAARSTEEAHYVPISRALSAASSGSLSSKLRMASQTEPKVRPALCGCAMCSTCPIESAGLKPEQSRNRAAFSCQESGQAVFDLSLEVMLN